MLFATFMVIAGMAGGAYLFWLSNQNRAEGAFAYGLSGLIWGIGCLILAAKVAV